MVKAEGYSEYKEHKELKNIVLRRKQFTLHKATNFVHSVKYVSIVNKMNEDIFIIQIKSTQQYH